MSATNIKVMIPVTQGSKHGGPPPTPAFDAVVEVEGVDDIVMTRLGDIEPYIRFSKRDLDAALRALNVPSQPVYRSTEKLPSAPGTYAG